MHDMPQTLSWLICAPFFIRPSVFTSSYACLWPSEFQKLLGIPGRQGAPARGSRFQVAGGKVPERLTALAVPAPESGGEETGPGAAPKQADLRLERK